MTGTRSKTRSESEVHVLDFSHDDNDSCALTALVKDFRFHIVASPDDLGTSKGNDTLARQYLSLIAAVKESAEDNKHNEDSPDSAYKPGTIPREEAKDTAQKRRQLDSNPNSDSGVDVGDDSSINGDKLPSGDVAQVVDNEDAQETLHQWMLEPFSVIFNDLPSKSEDSDLQSLQEWYSGPTYFYSLHEDNGHLSYRQVDADEKLEGRIKNLVPRISIPKYIRNLDIPWYKTNDVFVLTESDNPAPYRPSQVQAGDDTYYLKVVDKDQPQPTRREIRLLKNIESKGLQEKIRIPLVAGLVGWNDNKSEILGLLMTSIEDPTPLTLMLDSDVVEERREKWARETERVVKLLHANDIVWGDAKADNFVVDRHGDLWIIDFGGSYTDGWVDPELMETEEGDDMGVEKIVNALKDPEANTYDPDEQSEEAGQAGAKKRTAEDSSSDSADNAAQHKRRKHS
ncbi:hypothetical protein LQW54_000045 [Pestalotiopsis sp. IQ-011]